jgi:undecaprenyl-phosphate galactose phosphotransferase
MYKRVISVLTLVIFDILAIYVAVMVSHIVRSAIGAGEFFDIYDRDWMQFISLGLVYIVLISMQFFGLYLKRFDFWEELKRIIKAIFISFTIFLFYLFAQKSAHEYSRAMFTLIFLNLLWIIPLFRIISKRVLFKLNIWQKNIWFYGDFKQLDRLKKTLQPNWFLGYNIVKDLKDAKIVAIATKGMPTDELEKKIHNYKNKKKEILLIPYLHKIRFANTELVELIIGRLSLISVQNQLFKSSNIWIKKLSEWFVILLVFPFGFLIVIFVAVWIKLDSSGTIFYKQKRLGQDGKKFSCYKFRTMREDSEDDLKNYLEENPSEIAYFEKYHKYHIDPRFTKAGKMLRKLSLDELPQIFNVIRGDMSLIGPRPYMMSESEKLGDLKDIILHVKPGITGLWQVSGRNELTFKERVELDIWYIQNWSLWLDFVIFLKTFQVLLSRKGAS